MKKITLSLFVLMLVPLMAWAASDSRKPPEGRGKPPQEAFDACKGKKEGAAVEVITPHGKLKATCKLMQGQLVAVPEGAPPPPSPNSARQ
jgi:hypothetical protein